MSNFSRTRLARTSDVVDVVADVAAPAALTATVEGGAFASLTTAAAAHDEVVADLTALRATVVALRTALQTEA
jgi:hypothetical protein